MSELYRRIWIVTGRSQILLIVLSVGVAALAAVPLQFQKDIINGLSGSIDRRQLIMLCAGYLTVLVISSGLKFALQYRSSIMGGSVIRRIRERLYTDAGGSEAWTRDKRGTLVTMIGSEAEEVGQFVGGAIAALSIWHESTLVIARETHRARDRTQKPRRKPQPAVLTLIRTSQMGMPG